MRNKAVSMITVAVLLELASAPAANAVTDTVFALQQQYGTGYVDETPTKYDNAIKWCNGYGAAYIKRGWASFGLDGLPMRPTAYTTVNLHFFVVAEQNSPLTKVSYTPYANPITQLAQPLYDSLGAPSRFEVFNSTVDTGSGERHYIVTLPAWNLWPPNYPVSISGWTFSWLSSEAGNQLQFGEADGYSPPTGRPCNTKPFLEFIP
jgi:hypothetical protein